MATVRWIGNAQAVKQVTTIAVSGTWATSDTATLTINDKNVTVTVGTDVSTSNIADILARAVNGDDDTPNLLNDETRNVNGQEVPEFTEVVASNSGATLTLTSAVAGVPFTVTASESTAGTGALGTPTEATAATGPNFIDNADNWEGGNLPATNDEILFDSGSVPALYALDYFTTATKNISLRRTTDYGGAIGLSRINSAGYVEYRNRYLEIYDAGGSATVYFEKGSAATSNVSNTRLKIQSASNIGELVVGPGALPVGSTPILEVVGGAVDIVSIASGNVLIGDPNGSGGDVEITASAAFGVANGTATDCYVDLANAFISAAEDVSQHSGTVEYRTVMSYTGGGSETWTINGGVARYHYPSGSRALTITGGVFYPINHEGPSTVYLYGGEISYVNLSVTGGSNDYFLSEGATFTDPAGKISSSDFYTVGCTLSDVTITTAPNGRYTQAAGATIN